MYLDGAATAVGPRRALGPVVQVVSRTPITDIDSHMYSGGGWRMVDGGWWMVDGTAFGRRLPAKQSLASPCFCALPGYSVQPAADIDVDISYARTLHTYSCTAESPQSPQSPSAPSFIQNPICNILQAVIHIIHIIQSHIYDMICMICTASKPRQHAYAYAAYAYGTDDWKKYIYDICTASTLPLPPSAAFVGLDGTIGIIGMGSPPNDR